MLALKLIDESREIKNIIFAGKILIDLITKYCSLVSGEKFSDNVLIIKHQ